MAMLERTLSYAILISLSRNLPATWLADGQVLNKTTDKLCNTQEH